TQHNVAFERDWSNFINFKQCQSMEGGKKSARLDFFLPEESQRLQCLVAIENNEYQHVSYACELQRIFNCANALEQTDEHRGSKLLIINFNPHHYTRDGKRFSHK